MNTVSAGAMSAMTAPDDACAMNSIAGLTLSATPSMASPWMATAIWNTPRVPKRDPTFAPSGMNAAMANVPAVIAVPTDVAGVSRSVVMPAIDTVSAFTANDAWICVSTTTISASHDEAAGIAVAVSPVVSPEDRVGSVAPLMHAPRSQSAVDASAHPDSLYCGRAQAGMPPDRRFAGWPPERSPTDHRDVATLSPWTPSSSPS